jgi:hypothetical protein
MRRIAVSLIALCCVLLPASRFLLADGVSAPGVPSIGGNPAVAFPPTSSGGGGLAFDKAVSGVNGSTAALPLASFTAAGANELLIIGVEANGGPITSITSSSGSYTWSTSIQYDTSSSQYLSIFWTVATGIPSGVVFTIHATSSNYREGALLAFSGAPSGLQDLGPGGTSMPTSASNITALSISTSNTNPDVAVAFNETPSVTYTSGWVAAYTGSFFKAGYQIFPSAVTGNAPLSGDDYSVAAAFKGG